MKKSSIQWCDDTVNPVFGCCGCELWPNMSKIRRALLKFILGRTKVNRDTADSAVKKQFENITTATEAWHSRYSIILSLAEQFPCITHQIWQKEFEQLFRCYAGQQHMMRGAKPNDWSKPSNSGYAPIFDIPKMFPGRMVEAANWSPPTKEDRQSAPWLEGLHRLIFISDMGDALSKSIDFEFLKEEIIDNVISSKGQRHIWLWLTKRPKRMEEFSVWLENSHGITWPDNLVAMTSVTSKATQSRINTLRKIPCLTRGLSIEPLTENVELNLEGISWVIVGGESGKHAQEFDLSWARSIQTQCKKAGVAFFMKQTGANVVEDSFPITFMNSHGGDWEEWPEDLRVREFPTSFRQSLPIDTKKSSTVSNQKNTKKSC